jgi:CII-binding regulator of phage lambda lysogenization HflD
VSEAPSIEGEQARKKALRAKVARGPADAVAVFGADKISKSRELRLTLRTGSLAEHAARKLNHYWASLRIVERRLGRQHPVVRQLRLELEELDTLWPA